MKIDSKDIRSCEVVQKAGGRYARIGYVVHGKPKKSKNPESGNWIYDKFEVTGAALKFLAGAITLLGKGIRAIWRNKYGRVILTASISATVLAVVLNAI